MSASTYDDRQYCTVLTVHPTQIILTTEQVNGTRCKRHHETYKDNFKDNAHHDKVSKQARKKVSRALDYMMYLAKPKIIPQGYRGAGLQFKINFITMTLPAQQVHPDKLIIEQILQPFLNFIRKHYKVKNYIWRAEKQKNKNLHFHLILDRFIDKTELRQAWNRYLQNLGYVRMYKDNQTDWHNNGFKLRTKLLKFWPEVDQRQAYLTGIAQDWNNPNTTDVHSTKKIRNLKKYLCKYLCKNGNEKKTDEEINNTSLVDLLTISGRLWACSESLSKPKGAKIDYDTDIQKELNHIIAMKECRIYDAQRYTIFGIFVTKINPTNCPILSKLWADYIATTFADQ